MKAKKYLYQTAGKAAALAACLLLFSCSGDDLADYGSANGGKHSDNICFSISAADKAMAKGASLADSSKAAGEYTAARLVMRSPDTDDTLCVQTVISDGINVTSFEGGTAATRGVPVTSLETYGSFHVQAHCTDNGTPVSQFYMDDNATNSDGTVWSTSQVRYWPGENRTLQFFAWAPVDAAFTATPGSPESTTLEYTVPTTVTDQKDVVVATTEEIAGNANTTQPLAFRHICTAVKFKVGDQMQAGTIKKITISGVHNSGAYDMASDSWQLGSNTTVFSIEQDIEMTGNESGSMITDGENTFMMLPQELPAGAKVEIIFHDSQAGTDRTFSASIGGMTWPQGKTVTYTLSITPEYKFEITEENPVIDAHYVIFQTTLKVSGVAPNQSWTITAPTLDGANVTIQRQSDMNSWARQGYWTDRNVNQGGDDTGSARGTNTLSGTGSGEFPIAIFVPENIGEAERTVELSAGIGTSGDAVQTISIKQLCPSWFSSNLGCERLEGDPEPWGFYWDNSYKLVYDLTGFDDSYRRDIRRYVEWTKTLKSLSESLWIGWLITWIFGDDIPDLSFVEMEKSGTIFGLGGIADEITINLGSISTAGIATSDTDGQSNTGDVYNFEGIQFVNEIINMIHSIPGYTDNILTTSGKGVFPTENASIACMKLNSWNIISISSTDGTQQMLTLTSDSNLPDWYLPARNEVNGIKDSDYALNGEYWTSTAANDNQHAYKYNASGSITQDTRDKELNVRAVRKKPQISN